MDLKKNIVKIGVIVSILVAVVIITLLCLPSKEDREADDITSTLDALKAIPSDAVMVFHFSELGEFTSIINDTLSFGYDILDKSNNLIKFQERLSTISTLSEFPLLYSLHYSAKNEVSFLQVMNLLESGSEVNGLVSGLSKRSRSYNGVKVYSCLSNLSIAIYNNLLIASNSESVIESSIRHLKNKASLLDNNEFAALVNENGSNSTLYVNNKQIGKFFSGEVINNYLGYSDFFLNLSSWSVMKISSTEGRVNLKGAFLNERDPKHFSSIFYKVKEMECGVGELLPNSTLFAVWLPLSATSNYLDGLNSFMEVHRSVASYNYKQRKVALDGAQTPKEWADSLKLEGVATALCKFGDKNEWITFIKERPNSWSSKVVSKLLKGADSLESKPFKYKGYLASVYGDIFGNSSEEYYCKIGSWSVISSKSVIDEYVLGNAYFYNLNYFLDQTPAKEFLKRGSLAKVLANINDSPDTLLKPFKPYLKKQFGRSAKSHNFEYLTADVINIEESGVGVDINYYAQNLMETPKSPEIEVGTLPIIIDSTVIIPKGPYKVYDVAKREEAYLSQFPNHSLQYLNKGKKGVWAIPFSAPICGAVEQVDLYNNGKLQMMFISGRKLYLLDRTARYVYGYPVKLPKEVVLGPRLVDDNKGEEATFLTLNKDNTISQYTLNGKRAKGWSDIKAPEFVRDLPVIESIGNTKYWVLRNQGCLRLYRLDGKEVELKESKKVISPESKLDYLGGNKVKVMGIDEREFIINLETGKIEKESRWRDF